MQSTYFKSSVLIPEALVEGANELACIFGISQLEERKSFRRLNYQDPDGNKYCYDEFQTDESWWTGSPDRIGVETIVAAKNAEGVDLVDLVRRPSWDEENQDLDMAKALETLATIEIWNYLPELEEGEFLEVPNAMLLKRGEGFKELFGLTFIPEPSEETVEEVDE